MSETHIISKDLTKTDWSVSRDSFLLDKLIEQTSLGRRGENGWTKEAWNIIANAFNLNFRVRHSKQQLKSRFNLLRKQYRYVRMLQQQSGFVWDDRFKILTADNEVWDRYIFVSSSNACFFFFFSLFEGVLMSSFINLIMA